MIQTDPAMAAAPATVPADRLGGRVRLLLASLYTTQTLALMFFVAALIAILADGGADADRLTLVYMLGLVWPLKLLWAPVIDRWRLGRAGHYRGWAMVSQAGMVAVLVVMAGFDPLADFPVVYGLCLALALLSATQDVAVDGLACRLLPPGARGPGNALQISGGLLGTMLGAGGVLVLYPYLGWVGAMALLAGVTAISLIQLALFREPDAALAVAARTSLRARLARLSRADARGRALGWGVLLLIWPVGAGMAYALIMPALVAAGWPLDRIGLVVNLAGPVAGIAGALLAGRLAMRMGRRRALIMAATVQLAGIAAVALPVLGTAPAGAAAVAVCLYFLLYNPGATVMAMVMMDRASAARPATDYSVQSTLHAAMGMGSISAGAAIAAAAGPMAALWVAIAAGLLALLGSLVLYRQGGEADPVADPVADPPVGRWR
ncbi:MFS transporter [Tistrella sp. BH-R2-4]|uniref:MFS transporter n=1 Tax=Tistrella arctica TaxID=3133430 RepID=A0ABU9YGD0_9PROT